jgi:hypothetical protein
MFRFSGLADDEKPCKLIRGEESQPVIRSDSTNKNLGCSNHRQEIFGTTTVWNDLTRVRFESFTHRAESAINRDGSLRG